ncbi:ATP-dependent Clp protease ATP-binding subunit clpX-like, mitochondrial isoform X2 [Nylanderia fulva]|uniref:ATP-dependent Clp protease ATP-binding subunit clpX-like, mitochondrial isoform X2 n=1 Tax=Nylanderia fulva TaxID=613905 RepID=UPI0010FB5D50|nr:ATP-dependent Clp protease ATP-binding subunit clpX-like, mitochondrial isoform X2 [Nylanderia fulva]
MEDNKSRKPLSSPKKIFEYLNRYVVGQGYAKKVLSVAIYNHYKRIYHNLPEPKLKIQTSYNLYTGNMEQKTRHINQSAHGSATLDDSKQYLKLEKSNIMLLGPTGCGKTLLVQMIAQYLDVPFVICDCTTLTQSGYCGEDVPSVLNKLLQRADHQVKRAETGIVFLDEVDKLRTMNGKHRDVAGQGVQQELLKMVEGTIMSVPLMKSDYGKETIEMDTTNILFIASGAYDGLDKLIAQRNKSKKYSKSEVLSTTENVETLIDITNMSLLTEEDNKDTLKQVEPKDLIDFGMIPEFIGRFPILVPFHTLDKDMLVKILTEPQNSIICQYQELFSKEKVKLTFDINALNTIASQAMERKISARGLRGIIETLLLEPMFEIPESDIIAVHITEQCVKGQENPQYVKRDDSNEDDIQ